MSDMLAFRAMHYSFIPQITDDISVMINAENNNLS